LGFGYVGCWAINKLATIEDEGGRIHPNKANTFPRRSTRCHGLGYFGILWAMSCLRIFWDIFGNIMA